MGWVEVWRVPGVCIMVEAAGPVSIRELAREYSHTTGRVITPDYTVEVSDGPTPANYTEVGYDKMVKPTEKMGHIVVVFVNPAYAESARTHT